MVGGGKFDGALEQRLGLVEVVGGGFVVAGHVEVDEFVILLGEAHGVKGGGGLGGDALGELLEAALVAFEHRAENVLGVDADLFVAVLQPLAEERNRHLRIEIAEREHGVATLLGARTLEDLDDRLTGGATGQRLDVAVVRFVIPDDVAARTEVDGRATQGASEGQRSQGAEDGEDERGGRGEPPELSLSLGQEHRRAVAPRHGADEVSEQRPEQG